MWELLGALTTTPHDRDTMLALDLIHDDYTAHYADAVALTYDHTRAEAVLAGREAREAQRGNMEALRRELAAARRAGAPAAVGGREATRVLARAVVRRVRRPRG